MTSRKDDAAASEPSSPACSMHEADDAYMGYAGKEELTAILTELLEAERAGVRVTHESALAVRDGPLGGADAGDRKGRSTLVRYASGPPQDARPTALLEG